MATRFVDTNIFIRHLTNDDPQKAQACLALFRRADQNQVALITSEAVIAEVVFVLSSKKVYNLPRDEIRRLLYPLLLMPGLKLPNRQVYLRALDLYVSYPVDFEDVLTVAHMEQQHVDELVSYDRGLDQIHSSVSITRLEP